MVGKAFSTLRHAIQHLYKEYNIIRNEVIFEHDRGLSDKEISDLLGIPEYQVRYYLEVA